jgi:hypothetical protein
MEIHPSINQTIKSKSNFVPTSNQYTIKSKSKFKSNQSILPRSLPNMALPNYQLTVELAIEGPLNCLGTADVRVVTRPRLRP